jgi:hypothetical protein
VDDVLPAALRPSAKRWATAWSAFVVLCNTLPVTYALIDGNWAFGVLLLLPCLNALLVITGLVWIAIMRREPGAGRVYVSVALLVPILTLVLSWIVIVNGPNRGGC